MPDKNTQEKHPEGAPEGNTNAQTHGMYTKHSNYYKSLSKDDQEFIHALVNSWLEDAPFDESNVAKMTRLYKLAIDEHKLIRANDYYIDQEFVIEEETGFNPVTGESQTSKKENPINLTYDRLSRTTMSELKNLGILDSPEDRQADATASLAKFLSGMDDEE